MDRTQNEKVDDWIPTLSPLGSLPAFPASYVEKIVLRERRDVS